MTVAPTTDSPATDSAPADPPATAAAEPVVHAAVLTQLQNAAKLQDLMSQAWEKCQLQCDAALLEYAHEIGRLQAAASPWIRGD